MKLLIPTGVTRKYAKLTDIYMPTGSEQKERLRENGSEGIATV